MIPYMHYEDVLAKLKLGFAGRAERSGTPRRIRFMLIDSNNNSLGRIRKPDWFRLLDAPVTIKVVRHAPGQLTTTVRYDYARKEG